MTVTEKQQTLLRQLPGVDRVLELAQADGRFENTPRGVLTRSIREVIDGLRERILADGTGGQEVGIDDTVVLNSVFSRAEKLLSHNLVPLVNATGVVVHTNLGRSLLAREAIQNLVSLSGRYSNLEFDLGRGKRGSRYTAVEDILCEISGAESALVVNNNAAAVLICLETLAKGKEAVVSRGELVEIGGSFRIPDVMAKSGAILKEVGATNRTHKHDYENAIGENTGLLLKVHTSNFSVVGFTKEVTLKELVAIGIRHGLLVMEDLGSGTFIDFSAYGLTREPTVQESVAAGADVVTFSGDKLLGGPQAGIIVGKKELLDKIKKNPINRALRIDKMTLAALESTLRLYREPDKAVRRIPTLHMMLQPKREIERKADNLARMLQKWAPPGVNVMVCDILSRPGGGSLPLLKLPSRGVGIKASNLSANAMEKFMRNHNPPIIGRIEDDWFLMDLRTVLEDELEIIEIAFKAMSEKEGE